MKAARTLLLVGLALLSGAAAPASARESVLDGYMHTRWTADNGAPPQIRSMAQTGDGWLWIGTSDGLFRFDGLRFERYPLPPRPGLAGEAIKELHAAANGNLYISYTAEGMSVLHADGRLQHLAPQPEPVDEIGALALDADGSLWSVGRSVLRYRGGRWQVVDASPEWSQSNRRNLTLDGDGRLWAVSDRGAWRLDRAAGRLRRVAERGGDLLQSPDGRVWLTDAAGTLEQLGASAGARPAWYAPSQASFPAQFDADGTLWMLNCPQVFCLLPGAGARAGARYSARREAAALLDAPAALTGSEGRAILLDREGSIWIATERGLDRFRRKAFAAGGLPGAGSRYSLAADGAGAMWAADQASGTLWRLAPDAPPQAQPGPPVVVIAPGYSGTLLVGGKRSIQRRGGGAVEDIALPPGADGRPADLHMVGILDDGKVLWTATLETGLIGWRDGKWLPRAAFNLPPKIYQSAPGGRGQLWLATGDGKLVFYDDGKLAATDIAAIGMVSAIFPGAPLTLGGGAGFGVVKDGRLRLLRGADPDALRNISGMVATPDGDRWLNGNAGVLHVRAADWRRSTDDPAVPLRYELFDKLDGYPGQAVIETRWASARSADGRNLWLAASGGIVRLDTGALPRNPVAPTPVILRLAAGQDSWPPLAGLRLPSGTDQFRIDFTAPAMRKPEAVRFAWRLDGVDREWQDGGTRRSTSYTNIKPGSYTFHLRAVNEDGVAGRAEAVLPLSVAPTLVQSAWFRALCGLALALLGMFLYRWRVRWLTARLTERMRVKTDERERIARTLHDTFLQTVQGLVLRVDAVAASLPRGDRARGQLETVLEDAGSAIGEGRDRLQELRADAGRPLEDALLDMIERLRSQHGIGIELAVTGERRELHPGVAFELADLAREALRNAALHAGARRLRVGLDYGRRALALEISDDGNGFPSDVLRDGARSGHWGLVGMREIAERLGTRLELGNHAEGGATVALAVPAARAYETRPAAAP